MCGRRCPAEISEAEVEANFWGESMIAFSGCFYGATI
jgi:hypothetical protein